MKIFFALISLVFVLLIVNECNEHKDYTDLGKAETLLEVKNGLSFEKVNEKFKSDIDVVTEAVKVRGNNIGYASDSLKKNRDLAQMAIEQKSPVSKFCRPGI